MSHSVPYRVLVTGIPVNVSPEAFYDTLRASTAERGVQNALLVQAPATPPTRKNTINACHAVGGQLSRRGTGAAFIDFDSKAYAEAVMQAGLWVAGAEVQWRMLGPVRCTRGSMAVAHEAHAKLAYKRGREAFEAQRWHACDGGRDRVSRTEQTRAHSPHRSVGCVTAEHITSDGSATVAPAEETEVETLLTTSDVELEDVLQRSSLHDSLQQASNSNDVMLYNALDKEIRRCTFGHVRSLSRLSAHEVHVTTDEHTAALLQELGHLSTRLTLEAPSGRTEARCTPADSYRDEKDEIGRMTRHVLTETVRWTVQPASHFRLDKELLVQGTEAVANDDTGNFILATKSEVLEAMASMMSATGGKYAALQDAYGNLYLAN